MSRPTLVLLVLLAFLFLPWTLSPGRKAEGALAFPATDCLGASAAVNFSWQPAAGATVQWLDLSTIDNGFQPGTFVGAGPLSGTATSFTWSGILRGVPHVWRLNALTPSGWVTSETGAFVPCGGPALLWGPITCGAGSASASFRWAPASSPALVQWIDLSVFDNGFAPGTFLSAGPISPTDGAFIWTGIRPGVQHFFRVNALTLLGWASTATGSFVADCPTQAASPQPEVTAPPTADVEAASRASGAAVCQRLGGLPCYAGALFDAHLHMGPLLATSQDLLATLSRDSIGWALGFNSSGPDPAAVDRANQAVSGAASRIVPLFGPPTRNVPSYLQGFPDSPSLRAGLRSLLLPNTVFAGLGEITLYDNPVTINLTFQSPQLEALFGAAADAGGLVMVHPRSASQFRNPNTSGEVEEALQKFPNTIFILHGPLDFFDLIEPLFSRYPNLYWSFELSLPGNSTSDYLARLASSGVDRFLDGAAADYLPRFSRHPDRIMWGTDRFQPWHFDAATSGEVVELSRRLISRLPPGQQEDFAYRNALRLLGKYLVAPQQ